MQQRSNRGSEEPVWVNASLECAKMIRDPIRGKHEGQRSYAPHQQAGQMTAPDQPCIDTEKTLANMAPSTDDPRPTNRGNSRFDRDGAPSAESPTTTSLASTNCYLGDTLRIERIGWGGAGQTALTGRIGK